MGESFRSTTYQLIDEDRIVRSPSAPGPSSSAAAMEETQEVLQEIGRFVHAKLTNDMGFESLAIPDDEHAGACTSILASPNWQTASKLLIIIQNAVGSLMVITDPVPS